MKKLKTVFWGTQRFAAEMLKELLSTPLFFVALVITRPDKPAGRGQKNQKPLIKILAEKFNLPLAQPGTLKNFVLEGHYDLGVAAQYGLLIPKKIIEAPRLGILNVHPSLLPKYRGASPIQAALLNDEKETGVTIMKIDEGLDSGPVLAQKKVEIAPEDTYAALEEKLMKAGKELLLKTAVELATGKTAPHPQAEAGATYCRELKREDGRVDWKKPARQIYNMWRAYHPWPGVFGEVKARDRNWRVKFIKWRYRGGKAAWPAGTLFKIGKKELGVAGGDSETLLIEKIQPEGKKIMTSLEFMNGLRL
ncbi:MAG: methionyl-tRNA formyltransferase [Candidatus Magasanikbacteria bacterium]|nr:methionyl-tRNA formyltransferase [Candidatus Magasanikbacteria bacterium]